jgi:hypothetical protein
MPSADRLRRRNSPIEASPNLFKPVSRTGSRLDFRACFKSMSFILCCFRFIGQNTTRTAVGALRDYHSGCNLWDDVVLDAERCAAGDPALERSTRPGRSTVARSAN